MAVMGVQCFDENGAITFDSADSLGRIVAVIYVTTGKSGSQAVNLSGGRPFAVFQNSSTWRDPPALTFDQWGVSWSYDNNLFGDSGVIYCGYY